MVDRVLLTSCPSEGYEMLLLDTGRTRAGEGKATRLAPINFYYYFRQLLQLVWFLLFNRPDILHQSVTDRIALWKESSFVLIARLFGVKTVAHMHGCVLDVQLHNSPFWKKRLIAAALRVPHTTIALSEYWRAVLHEQVSPRLDVVVVPNSVDLSIAEAVDNGTHDIKRENGLVLYMGWLCERKGLLDALRAVPLARQQVPELHFVFAGKVEPGYREAMIEQACEAAQAQGGVSFPGLVTGNEKVALLSQAAIFILPSYHENLPVAILEAMAMGLPVITTPIAGVPELIEDGRGGFLVQPGDHVALANRIVRLARDPALRWAMGQDNMARVRREYLPQVFASRIANVYDRLLQRDQTGETEELVSKISCQNRRDL